jgi:DNA-binding transcriptional ArsR family regulator
MERLLKALAEPTRCRVLFLLSETSMPASEISRRLAIPKPTLSAHLAILRDAELVSVERDGTLRIYTFNREYLQSCLIEFALSFNPARARLEIIAEPAKRA